MQGLHTKHWQSGCVFLVSGKNRKADRGTLSVKVYNYTPFDPHPDSESFSALPWMPNRTVLNMRDERKLSSPIELPTSYFSPCSINKGYWICDHASRIINTIFPLRIICGWFMLLSHQEIQERGTGKRINTWHSMVLLHASLHRKGIIQADRGLWSPPGW